MTPGFVGADLAALTKEAAASAVTRIFSGLQPSQGASLAQGCEAASNAGQLGTEEGISLPAQESLPGEQSSGAGTALVVAGPGATLGQPLSAAQLAGLAITSSDFDAAVKKVQPSVRREGFATTPDITWNDVGSLAEVPPFSLVHPLAQGQQSKFCHLSGTPFLRGGDQGFELTCCHAGEGGARIQHHTAHTPPGALCRARHGRAHGRAAVWAARLRQDPRRQGCRQ